MSSISRMDDHPTCTNEDPALLVCYHEHQRPDASTRQNFVQFFCREITYKILHCSQFWHTRSSIRSLDANLVAIPSKITPRWYKLHKCSIIITFKLEMKQRPLSHIKTDFITMRTRSKEWLGSWIHWGWCEINLGPSRGARSLVQIPNKATQNEVAVLKRTDLDRDPWFRMELLVTFGHDVTRGWSGW